MTRFHLYDWIAILTYVAFALGVGIVMTKKASHSTEDFYLAGRTLPWWVAGTSLVATTFAADTPLLVSGWVRVNGIAQNWLWWGMAVGGSLTFVVIAGWWRRAKITTDAEFIELRYSAHPARFLRGFYGAYHSLVTNTLVLVWVLTAMVKLVRVILDVEDDSLDILIVGGALSLALVYSFLSGLWGVVITDFVQFFLALSGGILLAMFAIDALGGMQAARDAFAALPSQTTALIPESGFYTELGTLGAWDTAAYWSSGFGAFLIFVGIQGWLNKNSDGSGPAVQRYSACRNENHARGAALWYHIAHYCLRPWPWIIVGLASLVLIDPSELPTLDSGSPDHEAAYALMMAKYLGPGFFGLICASFLAAFMSTLDTHLNMASAYMVNDLYRRFMHRSASEKHYVWVGRSAEILVGVIAAFFAVNADSISDLFTLSLSLLGGVGPAMLLRWFWWRTNVWTELSALATSSLMTLLVQTGVLELRYPLSYLVVVGSSALVCVTVTLLTPPAHHDHLQRFHDRVVPFGWWGPFRSKNYRSPTLAFIFGWSGGILLIYGLMLGIGSWLLERFPYYYLLLAAAGAAMLTWSWPRVLSPIEAPEEKTPDSATR